MFKLVQNWLKTNFFSWKTICWVTIIDVRVLFKINRKKAITLVLLGLQNLCLNMEVGTTHYKVMYNGNFEKMYTSAQKKRKKKTGVPILF